MANWVHDVGYTNEKLHAGILQRLIRQAEPERQRAVLAKLWLDATSEHLPDGALTQVNVQREAPLDGRRLRLDLLVSFCLGPQHYRLGLELKVDSRPDPQQLKEELAGLKQTSPPARVALVLLCLGTAQVCHCALPNGVRRWSADTLVHHRQLLCDALPNDPIVAGWLDSLQIEGRLRMLVLAPPPDLVGSYRDRGRATYGLGCLDQALTARRLSSLDPWHTKIHLNGPVITAHGSWRQRRQEGIRLWVFVEINEGGLYVKAGTENEKEEDKKKRSIDPRPFTGQFSEALKAELCRGPDALTVVNARFRPGEFSSLLKVRLGPASDLQRACDRVAVVDRIWAALPAQHGLLPE